ncbi:MAG: hypothetical protein GY953_45550 [bacterium]|nr:hypothetical protein [bacterium]
MSREHPSDACRAARPRLETYLDGELPEAEGREVEAHLAACPECVEELGLKREVSRRFRQAVRQTSPPAEFEEQVRSAIRERQASDARPWFGSFYRVAAAVALLTMLAFGGGLLKRYLDQERLIDDLSAQLAQVFRSGFGDHLHCALFRESKHPMVQQLIEKTLVAPLGPEYEEVRRLVAGRPPDGLEIWMAHRCKYRGREFVHVALRGEDKLLSVILTPTQEGESFAASGRNAVQVSTELTLRHTAVDRFQVAGFESAGHLVFIISNLSEDGNLGIAAALGPALDRFLKSGSA